MCTHAYVNGCGLHRPLGLSRGEVHRGEDLLEDLSQVLWYHGLHVRVAEVGHTVVDEEQDLLPVCERNLTNLKTVTWTEQSRSWYNTRLRL